MTGQDAFAAARIAASGKVGMEALAAHPFRIDVRSPSEFAVDHVPGAVSWPVLDDAQRAEVGTLHAQVSAFAAKVRGAAIVARNIADTLDAHCRDRPRDWAPLVYCWRGGKRSGALTHILREIGWRAVQLDGGYRTYRRHVVSALDALPARLRFIVICGLTGSGKSRLLAALAEAGEQVLDLEGIAKHKGSLLGDLPDDPQPSQKAFDSGVLAALEHLDPERPVFVESESRKIGTVQVGDALLAAMRDARCVRVDTPQPLRVALLLEEYAHFVADPEALGARLAHLVPLHGRTTVDRWTAAARAGDFEPMVAELLVAHYDPTYSRSIERNFPESVRALRVTPAGISQTAFASVAQAVASELGAHVPAIAP
jgi:tRNA 2-selenouridine synthase